MIKAQLAELLETEVSRKEFLQYVGIALLAVFGIGSLLQALTGAQSPKKLAVQPASTSSYGGANYGGRANHL